MRLVAVVPALIALAACGGAPEPLPLRALEETDRRFAPARREDARAVADAILKKEELTLDDALEIADHLNPLLAAERKNVDLATAALWEAGLYPNPSLILEFEDYRTKDRTTIGRMERTVGLGFPIVVSGRIGAAASLAEKEREIAAVQYVWRRREILGGVRRAFVSLLAARRQAGLARETRDIARALHDATNERFKAEAIPEMELLKAAVNLAKAESDLRLAEKDAAVSLKALQAAIGDANLPHEKFSGELFTRFAASSLEALHGQVAALHPLIEAAAKGRQAAELQLSLAEAERIPDLDLELTVGRDPEDETIVEGGLRIPIPLFNRNQAKVAQAEARTRQAELQVQVVRNELALRLTETYRTFAAAQDRATVYGDEILPKAQKALDQTNEGYRLGKFGYLDLLDAQRTLSDARTAHVAALTDLNLAAVEIEKLTGTRLEPLR